MAHVDRFHFERELHARGRTRVAGVDEAGRGPLAGPVVAAVVMLPAAWVRQGLPEALQGLNDSKQLTEAQRERFFAALTGSAEVAHAIISVDAAEIDRLNILRATHLAMQRAVARLAERLEHVLVDGRPVPALGREQTAVVRGDARSYSIAAASVLAKVARDRLMVELDRVHPGYGFAAHKGYGTPEHLRRLTDLGPCAIHRRSFAPVRRAQREVSAR